MKAAFKSLLLRVCSPAGSQMRSGLREGERSPKNPEAGFLRLPPPRRGRSLSDALLTMETAASVACFWNSPDLLTGDILTTLDT